jgi:hypothetical protein
MKTYKNKNGVPIIRKCGNCLSFKTLEKNDGVGYCLANKLLFAFTHEKSVYSIVKDFYLCENHTFQNEDLLKSESVEVDLLEFLNERNHNKRS